MTEFLKICFFLFNKFVCFLNNLFGKFLQIKSSFFKFNIKTKFIKFELLLLRQTIVFWGGDLFACVTLLEWVEGNRVVHYEQHAWICAWRRRRRRCSKFSLQFINLVLINGYRGEEFNYFANRFHVC